MKLDDRIIRLLEYAGPGGASGSDIAAICNVGSGRLYVTLTRMETAGKLASEFAITGDQTKPRPRYYRLAAYKSQRYTDEATG